MENNKDVIEFRIAIEYLNIEDWVRIPRSRKINLKEEIIQNIQDQYGKYEFKERVYQSLLQWKMCCPETSNIEELIRVLKEENLAGPASDIEKAIAIFRNNDGAKKEPPVVTETTIMESTSTREIVKEVKKIKTVNSNVKHVSFSRDGRWFSTLGKGNHIQIWEWTSLSRNKFQIELAKPEAYAAYFNDGVIEDKSLRISVCTTKEVFIYTIGDEIPFVCRIDCDESVTYGSWFKRDEFMSGSEESGRKHLWLNHIIGDGKSALGYTTKRREILHRNDIKNATLLTTFQNKTLLCFKQGGNLEVINVYDGDEKALRQSSSNVFTLKEGNVGFFKLSSDLRNLFVLINERGQDVHRFLKIELEDLTYAEKTFDVHINGDHKYSDFGVTGSNVIIGSHNERRFFVCNLESKKCKLFCHSSKVCSVACHPRDPKAVITSDRGGNVLVWNLDDIIIK